VRQAHAPRLASHQIVGGVALAQPYYVGALYSEGRAPDAAAAAGPRHVMLTAHGDSGIELVAASQVPLPPQPRPTQLCLSWTPHVPACLPITGSETKQ
jgi:hypothetical protein